MTATAYPGGEWLPALDIEEPGKQHRLTVLLRWLLIIPQAVVAWVLGIAATIVAVIGWFAALVIGKLPRWAAGFLAQVVAYGTRVEAYGMLLTGRWPPLGFQAAGYPVQVELRPGRLNRLAVLFRIILAIPAAIVQGIIQAGWWTCAFFCWLVVLVAGRIPRPLFEATAAVLRYIYRYESYMYLLTSAYPKRLFGDEGAGPTAGAPPGASAQEAAQAGASAQEAAQAGASAQEPAPPAGPSGTGRRGWATNPLRVSTAGKVLLVIFIAAGILVWAWNYGTGNSSWKTYTWNSGSGPVAVRVVTAPGGTLP